ncbi:hypothetical protein SNEBB_006889 [Seison nebaliae]|nr:hypothetical protein SNEBB_006889 [Seison nebaliae]
MPKSIVQFEDVSNNLNSEYGYQDSSYFNDVTPTNHENHRPPPTRAHLPNFFLNSNISNSNHTSNNNNNNNNSMNNTNFGLGNNFHSNGNENAEIMAGRPKRSTVQRTQTMHAFGRNAITPGKNAPHIYPSKISNVPMNSLRKRSGLQNHSKNTLNLMRNFEAVDMEDEENRQIESKKDNDQFDSFVQGVHQKETFSCTNVSTLSFDVSTNQMEQFDRTSMEEPSFFAKDNVATSTLNKFKAKKEDEETSENENKENRICMLKRSERTYCSKSYESKYASVVARNPLQNIDRTEHSVTPVKLNSDEDLEVTKLWVTVFGFDTTETNRVLNHMQTCGDVADSIIPTRTNNLQKNILDKNHNFSNHHNTEVHEPRTNYIYLKYANANQVNRALSMNGKEVFKGMMIGVKKTELSSIREHLERKGNILSENGLIDNSVSCAPKVNLVKRAYSHRLPQRKVPISCNRPANKIVRTPSTATGKRSTLFSKAVDSIYTYMGIGISED